MSAFSYIWSSTARASASLVEAPRGDEGWGGGDEGIYTWCGQTGAQAQADRQQTGGWLVDAQNRRSDWPILRASSDQSRTFNVTGESLER